MSNLKKLQRHVDFAHKSTITLLLSVFYLFFGVITKTLWRTFFTHCITFPKQFSEVKLAECKQCYWDLKAKIRKINISILFLVFLVFSVRPFEICYAYPFTHSVSCPKQFSEGKSAEWKRNYRDLKAKIR